MSPPGKTSMKLILLGLAIVALSLGVDRFSGRATCEWRDDFTLPASFPWSPETGGEHRVAVIVMNVASTISFGLGLSGMALLAAGLWWVRQRRWLSGIAASVPVAAILVDAAGQADLISVHATGLLERDFFGFVFLARVLVVATLVIICTGICARLAEKLSARRSGRRSGALPG